MIDPITVAVLQNRLNAIAEEMGEAMLRTAYSQILNSSRDFSIALIAEKLGLEYTEYFGRIFKKKVGVTPANFRARMRAGNVADRRG